MRKSNHFSTTAKTATMTILFPFYCPRISRQQPQQTAYKSIIRPFLQKDSKQSRNLHMQIIYCNFAVAIRNPLERCRSGRSGRSRKPLCLLGTQGSNPCLSAKD